MSEIKDALESLCSLLRTCKLEDKKFKCLELGAELYSILDEGWYAVAIGTKNFERLYGFPVYPNYEMGDFEYRFVPIVEDNDDFKKGEN